MAAVNDSNLTLKFPQDINCSGQNYVLTGIELESNGTTNIAYDAEGAMKFIIVVVLVYGFAVGGVFALGVIHRHRSKMYQSENDLHKFVKGYDHIRSQIEKRSRVSAVTQLLKSVHGHYNGRKKPSDDGLFPGLAFIPLALQQDNVRAETTLEKTIKSRNSYDCMDYLSVDDSILNKSRSLLEPVMEEFDETDIASNETETDIASDQTEVDNLDLVGLRYVLSNQTQQDFSVYPVITNSDEKDKEHSVRMTEDSDEVFLYIDVNKCNDKDIDTTDADNFDVPV